MFGIYLFSLILGFGVLAIDMLGILSGESGDGDDGGSDAADAGGDSAEDAGSDADGDSGQEADLDADSEAVVLLDNNQNRWVYKLLNLLRNLIYFCIGFGAAGVFGTVTKVPLIEGLLWSIGTGAIILIIAKIISKLQSNVLDSQVKSEELLLAKAEVIVTINPGKLGRIRVTSGGSYHDYFAKGKDKAQTYLKGNQVYVVDVSGPDPIVDSESI